MVTSEFDEGMRGRAMGWPDREGFGRRPIPDALPSDAQALVLYQLGALRAKDTPPVDVVLVEAPEPDGPFGAKGIGELGLVPTAAAVAGALETFDGVRRYTLPMKDSPAAKATSVGRIRTKAPRESWR